MGIRQNEEEEARRRRHVAPPPAPPPGNGNGNGAEKRVMAIAGHEHGPHECYCPNCGLTSIVDAYIKCNTLTCQGCGERMRASQTGEYRTADSSRVALPIAQDNQGSVGKFVLGAGLGLAVLAIIGVMASRIKVE